jgi:hypothetical protein
VVVVPVINGLLYKRRIPATTWAACLMAITGVGLLTLQGKQAHIPICDRNKGKRREQQSTDAARPGLYTDMAIHGETLLRRCVCYYCPICVRVCV